MDGRQLDFPTDYFDWVLCRASLHHVRDWQGVVDEMLRVATGGVLIEEPLDDPRSNAKRNTMQAQSLFFEIQAEVGYPHYPYVKPEDLTTFLEEKCIRFELEKAKRDQPVEFEDFFEPWALFVEKSARKEYWLQRLSDYRRELGDGQLCKNDILFISACK